jgi:hypothetical protein
MGSSLYVKAPAVIDRSGKGNVNQIVLKDSFFGVTTRVTPKKVSAMEKIIFAQYSRSDKKNLLKVGKPQVVENDSKVTNLNVPLKERIQTKKNYQLLQQSTDAQLRESTTAQQLVKDLNAENKAPGSLLKCSDMF